MTHSPNSQARVRQRPASPLELPSASVLLDLEELTASSLPEPPNSKVRRMILLDTNVISELIRERPDPAVEHWLDSQSPKDLWTASVVLAELFSGIELVPPGRRPRELAEEIEWMISEDFQGQILDFDLEAAREYGKILAARSEIVRPIREFDVHIAAIAKVQHATVATRDVNGFENCGLIVIDPWSA